MRWVPDIVYLDRVDSLTATAELREEHRLILRVVRELAGRLAADEQAEPLDGEFVARCITFFRLFADACHHGKEEDLLFTELVAEGMSREAGPIAVMLDEHAQGRALVRRMAAALEQSSNGQPGGEVRDAAAAYIDLMEGHISKEDGALFNIADELIVGPSCRTLCSRYDEVGRRRFEGRTKEDLERLAAEILEPGPGSVSP